MRIPGLSGLRSVRVIIALLAIALSAPAAILAQQPEPDKSPTFAWVLSFVVPGLGQAYCDELDKGVAFFGGAVLGAAILHRASAPCTVNGDIVVCRNNWQVAVVGGVVLAGSWIWSQIDAPVTASKINQRPRGTASLDLQPRVVATPTTVGLNLATIRF